MTNDGGDVVVRNLGDLEIAELIQLDGGNVVVANDGAIMISGAIETQDQVDLAAAGSISQTSAGRIAASSLTVQSTGGLDLGGGNEVSLLALTNDGGNVVVRNLGALEIAEFIQLSGGDVRVTNDGAIVISGAIETQGEVDLAAAGSVSQTSAGRIAASSLKVQSTGGLDLGGGNEGQPPCVDQRRRQRCGPQSRRLGDC